MFLVGIDLKTGDYVVNANCCSMCKRLVINSGISRVIIRDTKEKYRIIDVQEWVEKDESLEEHRGY